MADLRAAQSVSGSAGSLPDHLLGQARKRIENLAFLLLALSMVGIVVVIFTRAFDRSPGAAEAAGIGMATHACVIVLDVGLLLAARSPRLSNRQVMTVALGYQVLVCAILSVSLPVLYWKVRGVTPNMTWSSIIIVLFPLVVPSPPRRAIATSALAAAMSPLGLWALEATGQVEPLPGDYGEAIISGAFVVAIASLAARIVYGYQRDLARAERLGSYQLVERIGEGGMGEVWQARHQLLARPAAVKLIRREVLAARDAAAALKLRQRFEREAQATAQLESPHTVELYDFGVSEAGDFYYVMELLRGIDLETLVKGFGPIPPSRAVAILRQICDSLQDAHDRGLIHRDIKPANVFLARVGSKFDFAKVLDFGLVKDLGHSTAQRPQVVFETQDNQLRGTPAYMAPEMIASRDIDARADIYSVGCLAYWLLSGTLVFQETTAMNMAIAHANKQPAPLSDRAEQDVPAELEALVMRCLAKDPGARPQSAGGLADLLEHLDLPRWTQRDARGWWGAHLPETGQNRVPSAT